MYNVILVGVGGFFGSIGRYLIYLFIRTNFNLQFPYATLIVNAIGCFAIGVLFGVVESSPSTINPRTMLLLSTGLIGGFTTFSAFGLETTELLRLQQLHLAALNVTGNIAIGIGAVPIGRMIAASIL